MLQHEKGSKCSLFPHPPSILSLSLSLCILMSSSSSCLLPVLSLSLSLSLAFCFSLSLRLSLSLSLSFYLSPPLSLHPIEECVGRSDQDTLICIMEFSVVFSSAFWCVC